MTKFLDSTGVGTLWSKVKSHVSDSISALSSVYAPISHTHTISDITDLAEATDSTGGLMTSAQAAKLAGIQAGAQVNAIAGIQKNGSDITPNSTTKKVNITVPTKTSDLTNDDNTVKDANYVHTDVNFTSAKDTKLTNIAAGAQVNVIETVKVNGEALTVTSKAVDVTVPTKTSDLTNDDNTVKDASYVHTDVNFTSAKDTKLTGIAANAQVNVIETVKVNGTALTPSSKAVNITVPTDNASLSNGAGYQTATLVNSLIDAKLTSAIIPKGSVAFASLPTPSSSNLGWMYNVTDSFTINNKFVEYNSSSTKTYPAGTNVMVVSTGTDTYKFDVMAGFVDLTNYYDTTNLVAINSTELNTILV